MKITLFLLALTFAGTVFADINDDCYEAYSKGKDAYDQGASYLRGAEAARKRILKSKENNSVEDFCLAAKDGDKQAHLGIKAFIRSRENFGNAYSLCSSPNDDKAHAASENARTQVDGLLAFSSEVNDGLRKFCDDE